ncbi:hypothetical protein ACNJ7E_38040 [Rhodococcus sp. NM-2]|uniref:hypothetical protein n=1 Tax=Rhodococcus sp. NM-2 TaxID=3401174 RepID=UPI003AAABBCA
MIAPLVIWIVGLIGTGLIAVIGLMWRWRYVLGGAGIVGVVLIVTTFMLPALDRDRQVAAAPVRPHLQPLAWGQLDVQHRDDDTGQISPGHIVYATVQVTAGGEAISLPSITASNPEYVVWLTVSNIGRHSDRLRVASDADGSPIALVPSHDDELVTEFGHPALPIPGASCAALAPRRTCEVTLVWWFYAHGPVAPLLGLTLAPTDSDPTATDDRTDVAYAPWPKLPPDPECRGEMAQFCGVVDAQR